MHNFQASSSHTIEWYISHDRTSIRLNRLLHHVPRDSAFAIVPEDSEVFDVDLEGDVEGLKHVSWFLYIFLFQLTSCESVKAQFKAVNTTSIKVDLCKGLTVRK